MSRPKRTSRWHARRARKYREKAEYHERLSSRYLPAETRNAFKLWDRDNLFNAETAPVRPWGPIKTGVDQVIGIVLDRHFFIKRGLVASSHKLPRSRVPLKECPLGLATEPMNRRLRETNEAAGYKSGEPCPHGVMWTLDDVYDTIKHGENKLSLIKKNLWYSARFVVYQWDKDPDTDNPVGTMATFRRDRDNRWVMHYYKIGPIKELAIPGLSPTRYQITRGNKVTSTHVVLTMAHIYDILTAYFRQRGIKLAFPHKTDFPALTPKKDRKKKS